MSRSCASVSDEYLLARLHGMWSSSVQGERLSALTQSTTPEILHHLLQEYGLDGSDRDAFYRSLQERRLARLRIISRIAEEDVSRCYVVMSHRPWYENIKTALHLELAPSRRDELSRVMYRCEGVPEIDLNEREWQLPPGLSRNEIEVARESMHSDGDSLVSDSIIDGAYYRSLREAFAGAPGEFRECGDVLLGMMIDILNIGALVRNARTYHLPGGKMARLWLDGGLHITKGWLVSIAGETSYERIVSLLPQVYGKAFVQGEDERGWEGKLWNGLYRLAKRYFGDFTHPQHSMAAYPFLLNFETMNLGRVYEGVYFAVPSDEMMKMMTGE